MGARSTSRGALACFATACVAAAAVAGCGGSSGGGNNPASNNSSGASAQIKSLLDRQDVEAAAYTNLVYQPAPSLSAEKSAIAGLRDSLYNANIALRKVNTPTSARTTLNSFLADSNTVISVLDQLAKAPSFDAIHSLLQSQLTPQMTKATSILGKFERLTGVKQALWEAPKPKGALIYSDTLSAPHGKIKWLLSSFVTYQGGGLVLHAPANGWSHTGPNTPYTYNSQHVSAEVDAKIVSGQPYYGIECPLTQQPSIGDLVGQLGPNGKWLIGMFRIHGGSQMLSNGTSSVVSATGVNHIRLDCDQYAPGFSTARLYVNGKFLGSSSAHIDLHSSYEPGVVVIGAGGGASSAEFSNWSVSHLATS